MKAIIKRPLPSKSKLSLLVAALFCTLFLGCKKFLSIDDPIGQVPRQTVFENEETATAAVTTLYARLRDDVLLQGSSTGINILTGIYSDELDYYGYPGTVGDPFFRHQVMASDATIALIWNNAYNLIYMCNSAIEGIDISTNIDYKLKDQLLGESLFVRGLVHFYLLNLFGDIPYVTSTDYIVNKDVSRMGINEVYELIILDLLSAKSKLGAEYISGERVRANRYVVSALLARVHLYKEEWSKAEIESSELISNSSMFHLESNVSNEFLKESSSAILQLKPKKDGDNTSEGLNFIFSYGPPVSVALSPQVVNTFEQEDLRRESWINEVTDGVEIWYIPYKYKEIENTGASVEYSIVLRMAEQYLIRAEARLGQGNIVGAKQDLNIIRNRAGLLDTDATSEAEVLETIIKERRLELFTEQGHRWFDLKRSGQAGVILGPLKPNWKSTDSIFPIPEVQLQMNPNLAPQNPGY